MDFTVQIESGRGGTGEMFQIVSLELSETDVTDRVDQGLHFHDFDDLKNYLSDVFNVPAKEITISID